MPKEYNPTILDAELKAAGLVIHGCSSNGRVDFVSDKPSEQDLQAAAVILAAHNPTGKAAEPSLKEITLALWAKVINNDSTAADKLKPVVVTAEAEEKP